MTVLAEDATAIEATLPLFTDKAAAIAWLFYDRLFEISPDVRSAFPDDLTDQGQKLTKTLAVAISSIRDWEQLAPILAALARRHVAYGVRPHHYAAVTQALLDTLRVGRDRRGRGRSMEPGDGTDLLAYDSLGLRRSLCYPRRSRRTRSARAHVLRRAGHARPAAKSRARPTGMSGAPSERGIDRASPMEDRLERARIGRTPG